MAKAKTKLRTAIVYGYASGDTRFKLILQEQRGSHIVRQKSAWVIPVAVPPTVFERPLFQYVWNALGVAVEGLPIEGMPHAPGSDSP